VALRSPGPGYGEQRLHADDLPLERAGDCRAVTAIVALCPFTPGNGATAVVPGSHRRPDLQRLARTLDPARHERVLTGPAGTVFLFDSRLVHRGTRNRSARPRPSLQVLWRPAPVRAPGQAPGPAAV
jgi:ectoine hydroxylase-related dioxygenase (phytanoyl-CoA dioxygenase family)